MEPFLSLLLLNILLFFETSLRFKNSATSIFELAWFCIWSTFISLISFAISLLSFEFSLISGTSLISLISLKWGTFLVFILFIPWVLLIILSSDGFSFFVCANGTTFKGLMFSFESCFDFFELLCRIFESGLESWFLFLPIRLLTWLLLELLLLFKWDFCCGIFSKFYD